MARKCFVIMPFAESFDGIWRTVVKPVVEATGDECLRADDIFVPGSVIADVVNSIREADYIIADVSLQNPNVYYELGFAHALDKPAILISSDLSQLPFDLNNQKVIRYSDTAGGAEALRESLHRFLSSI